MKKILTLAFFVLTFFNDISAQNKNVSKSIIDPTARVTKFHEKKELEEMQKGGLVDLYLERIRVLIHRIPFIALTNKAGISMQDIGIPENSTHGKFLDRQHEVIKYFVSETESCQKSITPFADKNNIINAILAYETILKDFKMLHDN
ncbi:hypothetical protein B0A78_09965 [Flavobacterium columnare NBRC 100251 = ATCC 23463]|uniref:DUF4142 domain-containing protein n=2 Tax=Flavobacterium columnare TaxID=996 RepID=G8X9B3_FLACA|nr:hypothetical protein [Flavobacterium columnare]AEW85860.1 hypothetical protein FCOL_05165 [Flavobacterium columnare ATCC 49512]AMO19002.1 hypothetical protein UN65_00275 [Flavobacterium columnare]ANO47915.1 hypothetical protein Pf1_02461 [Flavobacterium columnare]APT21499.1 hypothetical protein BU993_01895 [Flavobacterium columnare]MBF6652297.1 hypothetical protein [Flavobacterium columnare]